MEYLLLTFIAACAVVMIRATGGADSKRLLAVLLPAFFLRLVVHVTFLRGTLMPTEWYGGDQYTYEGYGRQIASIWRVDGIRFITQDDLPGMKSVAVPCNIFGAINYLCGGDAPLADTAAVALFAVALCLVIYHFAQEVGANRESAFLLCGLTAFGPSFVIHTSDSFKDGINAFLVITCLYLAVSTAKRFSIVRLALTVPALWMLWYVRPYMVFMCALPLVLGVIGLKRALSLRGLAIVFALLVVGLVFDASRETGGAIAAAEEQFDVATSSTTRDANAEGASGVTFDDGGNAFGALGPKVLYTLFSPFPWMGGSLALQLGKLETLLWYYYFYEAVRGLKYFLKEDRETLILLLMFLAPATIAYATSMSNVGLIFRQRMPITIVTSLLTAVVWTKMPRKSARALPSRAEVPRAGS